MLQLPLGITEKLTGNLELAVALTDKVVPTLCAGIGLKVMVWDKRFAVTLSVNDVI